LCLDVRIALVMGDEADARIVQDVLGVLRDTADEYDQTAVVIDQIGRDRTERKTREFFGERAECAVAMGAQHLSGFNGIVHKGAPINLFSGRIAVSRARSLLAYLVDMSRRSLRGSLRFIP
jgi:hypothetical protein